MTTMNRINDTELEKVNGGLIYCVWYPNTKDETPVEVIDDHTGQVLARFVSFSGAEEFARRHKLSTREVKTPEVEALRAAANRNGGSSGTW